MLVQITKLYHYTNNKHYLGLVRAVFSTTGYPPVGPTTLSCIILITSSQEDGLLTLLLNIHGKATQ